MGVYLNKQVFMGVKNHYFTTLINVEKKPGPVRGPALNLKTQIRLFEQFRFVYQINVCTFETGPLLGFFVVN